MPSNRRIRFSVLLAVLAILTIIYLTTGAQQTRNNAFYTKTVAMMERKANQNAQLAKEVIADATNGDQKGSNSLRGNVKHTEQAPLVEGEEETLRDRLKNAENAAKKSADDKWREVSKDHINGAAEKLKEAQEKTKGKIEAGVEKANELKDKIVSGAKFNAKDDADGEADGGEHKKPKKRIYEPEEIELGRILELSPVIIFSKSYCPHSKRAKDILLKAFTITPSPYVVELDQHELGSQLQSLLAEKTGRRTVPNVLVEGKSIGGGDDIARLWREGTLRDTIKKIAGKTIAGVVQHQKPEEQHVKPK